MGDYLKRAATGDPVELSAKWYNAVTDAAVAHQRTRRRTAADLGGDSPPEGLIYVRNDSGDDAGRFSVLGIDGILFGPDDNLAEFQNNFALKAVTPAGPDHKGKFVIAAEPIADGKVGRAFVFGTCPVQVDVQSESDAWADVADGVSDTLKTATAGAAQILWKESGTGTKWAVIRFGGAGTSGVRVKPTSTAAGMGWYNGFVWDPPTAPPDPAANAVESTIGTQGDACYILCSAEVTANHRLLGYGEGGIWAPSVFNATPLPAAPDGTPCYLIDSPKFYLCASPSSGTGTGT